jgi:hypothetical protein
MTPEPGETGPRSGAASTFPPVEPVPRRLSPADDGRTFSMVVGRTAGLVVPDPLAPDPAVEGNAVEVVDVVNVDASGQREWELRAIRPGRTVLRGAGSTPYVITFEVEAG